jgi:hypothetical protein
MAPSWPGVTAHGRTEPLLLAATLSLNLLTSEPPNLSPCQPGFAAASRSATWRPMRRSPQSTAGAPWTSSSPHAAPTSPPGRTTQVSQRHAAPSAFPSHIPSCTGHRVPSAGRPRRGQHGRLAGGHRRARLQHRRQATHRMAAPVERRRVPLCPHDHQHRLPARRQ